MSLLILFNRGAPATGGGDSSRPLPRWGRTRGTRGAIGPYDRLPEPKAPEKKPWQAPKKKLKTEPKPPKKPAPKSVVEIRPWKGTVATMQLTLTAGQIAEVQAGANVGLLQSAGMILTAGTVEVAAGATTQVDTGQADLREQWTVLEQYCKIAENKIVARVMDEMMILGSLVGDGIMVRETVGRHLRTRRKAE